MPCQAQILIPVGRLQLVFQRQGDRYGHRLELAPGAARSPRLEPSFLEPPFLASLEGSPDDAWPASPPLQECHVERRPDGRTVALLVGRAGKSHWSLSVLCDPASSVLLFEAACRLTGEPTWLGSRYKSRGTMVAESTTDGGMPAAGAALPELLLEARATGQGRCLCLPQPFAGEIDIAPGDRANGSVRTVEWSYQVRPVD